ncbi:MAG: Kelch repeat-containing protein [Candidatus Odinarchaeota archaeon]
MRKILKIILILLLFSGLAGYLRIFNSSDVLANTSPCNLPYPCKRLSHNMVYDSFNQRVILFGGMTYSNSDYSTLADTWSYDYSVNEWTELNTSVQPSSRSSFGIVYDSLNRKIVLFGGYTDDRIMNDTWIFDCTADQWEEAFPAVSPPARTDPALYYDSSNEKTVLFGGVNYSEEEYFGDLWIYDYSSNTWEERNPETKPATRYGHKMIYNNQSKEGILFGGRMVPGVDANNDLWVYNYSNNSWIELYQESKPEKRYWHDMVYDSDNNEIVVFGGRRNAMVPTDIFSDTWIYDRQVNQWKLADPGKSPSQRVSSASVYDSLNKKIIFFGGCSGIPITESTVHNDTWVYDIGTVDWSEMAPGESLKSSAGFGIAMVAATLVYLVKRKEIHEW